MRSVTAMTLSVTVMSIGAVAVRYEAFLARKGELGVSYSKAKMTTCDGS